MFDTKEEEDDWELHVRVTIEKAPSLLEQAIATFVTTIHYVILACLALTAIAFLFF